MIGYLIQYCQSKYKTGREAQTKTKNERICIEGRKPEENTRRLRHKGPGWRAPLWRQGGVIRVKLGSPRFPWIPGGYLQRGSTARTEREDAGQGKRGGCLPSPAYLLMHRLTFQCVFKRYDSFIRAIWYRGFESGRMARLALLSRLPARPRVRRFFVHGDRSLALSRSGSNLRSNRRISPLTWRKHRALSSSRGRIVYESKRKLLFFSQPPPLGLLGAVKIGSESERLSRKSRRCWGGASKIVTNSRNYFL